MERNLGQLLADSARRHAGRRFLACVDGDFSFAEVDRLATNAAHAFRRLGIRPGDVVSLWLENGWRWVAAYFGALRAGAVVNPLNVLLTGDEVDYIARHCGARCLVAEGERARSLCTRLGIPLVDDLSTQGFLAPVGRAAGQALPEVEASAHAAICYTSGTTGRPKGAVLTHRAVLVNACMTALMHGRSAADTVVSALPCTHVYGNIVLNSAVACGMTLVLLPRFEEGEALHAIERHRATMFEGVPAMYIRMLNHESVARADLRSLRLCTVGGQTMPLSTMIEAQKLFAAPLLELWGMTELAGLGTTHPHNWPNRLGSIGVPLPLNEARIADVADPARTLARGAVGELLVRGPTVMEGYFGDAQATAEAVEADGWLHTGDLAYQDPDGYFWVVERKKEVILTGGYNVYPAEIERVIAEHPVVAMVAVSRVEDSTLGEVAKAWVTLRPGVDASAEELLAHCRARLAPYKVPRAIRFVADLPRTSTGKILRRELHLLDRDPGPDSA